MNSFFQQDMVSLHDPSSYSISSHGSWSPGLFDSPLIKKREDTCNKTRQVASFDMDEYLKLGKDEELMFETYKERNRISSGGLLLCTGAHY